MQNKKVSVVIPTYNRSSDVIECVRSVLKSNYLNIEVIVADNGSKDDTVGLLEKNFQSNANFKLVKCDHNLGAGGGRNLGAKHALGEYILFVDSDNVVDKAMVSKLVKFFEQEKCCMVGPLMLFKKDPKLIWLYSADINMWTSGAHYLGTGENNRGQYEDKIKVGHLPNCFMVKKSDFEKIGGFDEKYLVMYEEADLAEKLKKVTGKNIYLFTKAVTFHNAELPDKNSKDKSMGFRTDERAFLTARNRVYFMKKNASFLQFIVFLAIFNLLYLLYYEVQLLKAGYLTKARAYLKGSLFGLFY